MASGSPRDRFPVGLQVIRELCILCVIALAPVVIAWNFPAPARYVWADEHIHHKIIAINDFHGQLPPGTNPDPLRTAYLVVDEEATGPEVNRGIRVVAEDITRVQGRQETGWGR